MLLHLKQTHCTGLLPAPRRPRPFASMRHSGKGSQCSPPHPVPAVPLSMSKAKWKRDQCTAHKSC